jgi:hypothetical protein
MREAGLAVGSASEIELSSILTLCYADARRAQAVWVQLLNNTDVVVVNPSLQMTDNFDIEYMWITF